MLYALKEVRDLMGHDVSQDERLLARNTNPANPAIENCSVNSFKREGIPECVLAPVGRWLLLCFESKYDYPRSGRLGVIHIRMPRDADIRSCQNPRCYTFRCSQSV